MYKYFKKDDYNVMEFDFDSITEFLRYNDEAPICRSFRNESLASNTGTYSFTKTHSYDEAQELCKYGFHEEFEKLVDLKYSLEKYIKMKGARVDNIITMLDMLRMLKLIWKEALYQCLIEKTPKENISIFIIILRFCVMFLLNKYLIEELLLYVWLRY